MEIILWKNAFFLHLVYEILILRPKKLHPRRSAVERGYVFHGFFYSLTRSSFFIIVNK